MSYIILDYGPYYAGTPQMPPRACGCVLGAQLGRCCQEPPDQGVYALPSSPITEQDTWRKIMALIKPRIRVKAGREVVA